MRAPKNWLEPHILGAIAVATGSLWGFIEIADAVLENELGNIDTTILLSLRSASNPAQPLGPAWFQETVRDLTALGSPINLLLLVITAVIFLAMAGRRSTALFVTAATGGGALLSIILKYAFNRPRPELVPHATSVFSASFPSGHAMLAAVVYFTLAALVARVLPTRRLKLFLMAVAIFITVLVGVSRIYLGVHWPSDVLGGWALGAAWALGCWIMAELSHSQQGEKR